jgi:hypothetical protein
MEGTRGVSTVDIRMEKNVIDIEQEMRKGRLNGVPYGIHLNPGLRH